MERRVKDFELAGIAVEVFAVVKLPHAPDRITLTREARRRKARKIQRVEEFLKGENIPKIIYLKKPGIAPRYRGDENGLDEIVMRDVSLYHSSKFYYHSLFHELIHSTGHRKRLGRIPVNVESSWDRTTKEEFIAELGALFMAREFGFLTDARVRNSALYLRTFIEPRDAKNNLLSEVLVKSKQAFRYLFPTREEEKM